MDASCKIQRSIHDVRLTYKYVSRILGTYHIRAAFYIGKSLRMSKNIELIVLCVESHRVTIKKLLGCMTETHNNSNRKYS